MLGSAAGCARVRKAVASQRDPRRASLASEAIKSDRAPLSWTSEGAAGSQMGCMLGSAAGCARVRKAAASQRDPRRASLASEAIKHEEVSP